MLGYRDARNHKTRKLSGGAELEPDDPVTTRSLSEGLWGRQAAPDSEKG